MYRKRKYTLMCFFLAPYAAGCVCVCVCGPLRAQYSSALGFVETVGNNVNQKVLWNLSKIVLAGRWLLILSAMHIADAYTASTTVL